jgi:hypothetical protein
MREPTSTTPLARAFLALADDRPAPTRRSLSRSAAAALAAVVLALAVPLGWLADHPVAVLSSKAALIDGEASG